MTSPEPETGQSADSDIPDTEVIVVSAATPVFVDSTGRRGRRLRRLAYVFGAICVTYGGLISVSLAGGPVSSSAILPLPDLPDHVDAPAAPRPSVIPTPKVTPSPTPEPTARFVAEAPQGRRAAPASTKRRTVTPAPPKPPARTPSKKPSPTPTKPLQSTSAPTPTVTAATPTSTGTAVPPKPPTPAPTAKATTKVTAAPPPPVPPKTGGDSTVASGEPVVSSSADDSGGGDQGDNGEQA